MKAQSRVRYLQGTDEARTALYALRGDTEFNGIMGRWVVTMARGASRGRAWNGLMPKYYVEVSELWIRLSKGVVLDAPG